MEENQDGILAPGTELFNFVGFTGNDGSIPRFRKLVVKKHTKPNLDHGIHEAYSGPLSEGGNVLSNNYSVRPHDLGVNYFHSEKEAAEYWVSNRLAIEANAALELQADGARRWHSVYRQAKILGDKFGFEPNLEVSHGNSNGLSAMAW